MARNIATGIDVGSTFVRVAVCEYQPENGLVVRALVKKDSTGLKNGHIVSLDEVTTVVGLALEEAERIAGVRIKRAIVAAGGIGLQTFMSTGTVAIARADKEITELDISRVMTESEEKTGERLNAHILHPIPLEFKVDGKRVLGKPDGLRGNKLEVKSLLVTIQSSHLSDLTKAIENNGVVAEEFYATPIAESIVTVTPTQKNAGCIIANIGSQTVSIATLEESLPTSVKVFPLGSTDITNDIALGLRISLEEAEDIKKRIPYHDKRIVKRVHEIIDARLSDIFEIIDTHLRKMGRSGLLPAGIVFTGGGANTENIVDRARERLNLPARIAENAVAKSMQRKNSPPVKASKERDRTKEREEHIKRPEWSVVYGLCVLGLDSQSNDSAGLRVVRRTKNTLVSFVKQFLP